MGLLNEAYDAVKGGMRYAAAPALAVVLAFSAAQYDANAQTANSQQSDAPTATMLAKNTPSAPANVNIKTPTQLEEISTARVKIYDRSAKSAESSKIITAALSSNGRLTFKMHNTDKEAVQKVVNFLNELGSQRNEIYNLVVAKGVVLGAVYDEVSADFQNMDPLERVDLWLGSQEANFIGPLREVDSMAPFEKAVISARRRLPKNPEPVAAVAPANNL